MTTVPTTKYAKSGDVHIAYQVVGEGPQNLVLVPGWVSHLEYAWEEPYYSALPAPPGLVLTAHPPRPAGHRTVGPRELICPPSSSGWMTSGR